MIRVLGVMLIFFSAALVGMSMSVNMKKKLDRLALLRRMADEISTLIRYRSLTVREIITELRQSGMYSELHFLYGSDFKDRSRPVSEIWESTVLSDCNLSREEKTVLCNLGTQLGTTDSQGQLSLIAAFSAEIEEMYERQKQVYAVKGKLYRSMGILIGAMVGIMII